LRDDGGWKQPQGTTFVLAAINDRAHHRGKKDAASDDHESLGAKRTAALKTPAAVDPGWKLTISFRGSLCSAWLPLGHRETDLRSRLAQGEDAITVKISPLEVGSTFQINFARDSHHCEATSTDRLVCKYVKGARFNGTTAKYEFEDDYRYFVAAVMVQNVSATRLGALTGTLPVYVQSMRIRWP
jgi:hypothetical protein